MTEHAKDRVAKNEALFRHVNDQVEELALESQVPTETIEFLCECGDARCLQPVPMHLDEYEHLRSNPVHFVVLPGHERLDVERVVLENDRLMIVEKLPGEQEIARATATET